MRPLIGISTYREQARWGAWDVPAVLLPASYADAVAEAGGEPVLLPTGASTAGVVDRLDGLVLAGGADVDPARYGATPGPHTTVVRPERDEAELAVLHAALDRDLPLLAICRGMQLLNVTLGGDLVQHLPDVPGAGSDGNGGLPPSPGARRHRPGADADGLGRGRRRRGGGDHRPPVLPGNAVASGGGPGPQVVRRSRDRGAGADRVTAASAALWALHLRI
jgi:gamma-glutamyl-gamma-aminobutyrate hydrolase PuuD